MSDKIFLQEMTSSVAFFDVRRFSVMSAQLGPVDVGVALRRYYEHVEGGVLSRDGRIVKFMSDGVLAIFPSVGDKDHAGNALAAVRDLGAAAGEWLEENQRMDLPALEYSIGVASGGVLYGELGTAKLRAFDVLGLPVIQAIRLARLATVRSTPHLIAGSSIGASRLQVPSIELEGVEIGKERVRLYRLLSGRELADAAGG
jgi:adenylate cyclase